MRAGVVPRVEGGSREEEKEREEGREERERVARDTAKAVRHLSIPGTVTSISSITRGPFSPKGKGKIGEEEAAEFPAGAEKFRRPLVTIACGGAATPATRVRHFSRLTCLASLYRGSIGQEL